jgi:transcriptional regulator with XRE-family HTH domain
MPRRTQPDPLASKIGARVRALRAEAGVTSEGLAYAAEPSFSKGQLSTIEGGLALPTARTLATLADGLDLLPFDLLVFPDDGARQRLVDLTRKLSSAQLRAVTAQVEALLKATR